MLAVVFLFAQKVKNLNVPHHIRLFEKLLNRSKTLVFVHMDTEKSVVDTKSLKSDCI